MSFASRFHRIVAAVYSVVFLCALLLFFFLYQENHESRLNSIQQHLIEQTQALSALLRVRYDAVNAMRSQAEDFMIYHAPRDKLPSFRLCNAQNKKYFYLDIRLENFHRIGNITGLGCVEDLSKDAMAEISMAYALNPLFKILKENIKTAVSISYISKKGFQNLYPWRPSSEIRFMPDRLEQEVFTQAMPDNNPEHIIFWTDAFTKTNSDDLMVTCAAPIYYKHDFLGVVALDFMLTSVEYLVDRIQYQDSRMLLINEQETVLTDTDDESDFAKIIKVHEALPIDLTMDMIKKGEDFVLFEAGKYWVFKAKPDFSPWKIIFYMNAFDLSLSTLRTIGPSVILTLILATFFLIFSNKLIAQEFIKPAQRLMQHIATQAVEPESTYQDVLDPWLSWFNAVTKVFEENRNLVLELEKHILELDHKVIQRTKAISMKNSELQKAMIDLCKAQDQIVVQEKLAGLGAITAGISHEIKNPLNFILNFTEISQEFLVELMEKIQNFKIHMTSTELQDLEELEKSLIENMTRVENHAKRADAIVRSMLIHAKGGVDILQPTNIHELLDENILLAISGFKYQTTMPVVEKIYDETIPDIRVYRQELGRVLLNIISNACYILDQKKQLQSDFEPKILITTFDLDPNIQIHIRDNGLGMPNDVRKQLFDPFFTTKPAGSGTGLGLSLSYDIIVNQHDGKILVTSQENEFTEFVIILPKNLELASLSILSNDHTYQ